MFSSSTHLHDAQRQIVSSLPSYYSPEEAKAIARRIVLSVVGISLTQLLIEGKDTFLSDESARRITEIVRSMQANVPLQYLLDDNSFGGIPLKLSPATLIPRPETEEMCLMIGSDLADRSPRKILDLGTGSGCIALYMASLFSDATVYALEKSEEAAEVARFNFEHYAQQTKKPSPILLLGDMLRAEAEPLRSLSDIDLVVSNPPYIPRNERTEMLPHVVEKEPDMALFVENDAPLLFYEALRDVLIRVGNLEQGVSLYCETHYLYAEDCQRLFASSSYCVRSEALSDLSGRPRFVKAYFQKR